MMFVTDTIEATHHAVSKGWILEGDIAQIVDEKKVDESMAVHVKLKY